MMEAAQQLLSGEGNNWLDLTESATGELSEERSSTLLGDKTNTQLRLL